MSNRKYDELMRALVPKQPGHQHPTHGQHPTPYPGQPYPPAGPYHHGNAPIQYPQYPRMEPGYPPVEPYYPPVEPEPIPGPPRDPRPKSSGPSWMDGALIFIIGFMFLAFIFGIFSG